MSTGLYIKYFESVTLGLVGLALSSDVLHGKLGAMMQKEFGYPRYLKGQGGHPGRVGLGVGVLNHVLSVMSMVSSMFYIWSGDVVGEDTGRFVGTQGCRPTVEPSG